MKGKRYIKEMSNDIKKRITEESKNGYHPEVKKTFFWKLDKIKNAYNRGIISEIETIKEIIDTYEIFKNMPDPKGV